MKSIPFFKVLSAGCKQTRKKHPGIGFDSYAFSSVPGSNGPGCADAGAGECAGDAGGAAGVGESVTPEEFKACLESMVAQYPNSGILSQISGMFNSMLDNTDNNAKNLPGLYHTAEGMEYRDGTAQNSEASATDELISSLAASCESALSAFKQATGYDYCEFRKKSV